MDTILWVKTKMVLPKQKSYQKCNFLISDLKYKVNKNCLGKEIVLALSIPQHAIISMNHIINERSETQKKKRERETNVITNSSSSTRTLDENILWARDMQKCPKRFDPSFCGWIDSWLLLGDDDLFFARTNTCSWKSCFKRISELILFGRNDLFCTLSSPSMKGMTAVLSSLSSPSSWVDDPSEMKTEASWSMFSCKWFSRIPVTLTPIDGTNASWFIKLNTCTSSKITCNDKLVQVHYFLYPKRDTTFVVILIPKIPENCNILR